MLYPTDQQPRFSYQNTAGRSGRKAGKRRKFDIFFGSQFLYFTVIHSLINCGKRNVIESYFCMPLHTFLCSTATVKTMFTATIVHNNLQCAYQQGVFVFMAAEPWGAY